MATVVDCYQHAVVLAVGIGTANRCSSNRIGFHEIYTTRSTIMANSGILWIDSVYDWAVIALVECAKLMGISYEEINVWLFCIIWPVFTMTLVVLASLQFQQNSRLRKLANV